MGHPIQQEVVFYQQSCMLTIATRSQLYALSGHSSTVNSVCFRNQSTLISGSKDHTIRIWDTDSRQCPSVLEGHTGTVYFLLLHNNLLVSGSADRTAKIWDVSTYQCLHTLGDHSSYVSIAAFNNDHTLLATGSGGGMIKIWKVDTG